jgi:hypothetical integral membrane protein (TIGR02206 family)
MPLTFHLFSPGHLAVIAAVPIFAALLAAFERRRRRAARTIRMVLALLLVATTAAHYASYVVYGEEIFPKHLPLELCDASLWITAIMLIWFRPGLFDIAYYWALAGASMAVLTPNLSETTWFDAIEFFASHGLTVAAVLYLVWTKQARPRRGSVLRAMVAVNGMAVVAGSLDYFFGTDYMYLRAKPVQPTLLDVLGPWPWYIVSTEFVGLALFLLLYLPFWRSNRVRLTAAPEEA